MASTHLTTVIPFQPRLCTAIGVLVALAMALLGGVLTMKLGESITQTAWHSHRPPDRGAAVELAVKVASVQKLST